MFQRAGFLGPVKLAASSHRPSAFSRRLGGMLEDYNNQINELKGKLSKLQKPYMQPAPPQPAFPFASPEPSTYSPPYQPPSGQLNCYTRPNGSVYYGYPDGISTPNNLTEFQCAGVEQSDPLEPPPPPTITSDIDLPGPFVPIAVREESEIPPPVPTQTPHSGDYPSTVTGIPYGEPADPSLRYYWPPPGGWQLAGCPEGILSVAPGASCPSGTSKTVPGSNCCYPDVASTSRYGDITGIIPGGLQFGGEGGVSAPVLNGRRTYPVVNLRPRRW